MRGESNTLNLISFSGGKDSCGLALYLKSKGVPNLHLVFSDTKWEHEATNKFIHEFAKAIGIPLVVLESEGMHELILRKGRMPSVQSRFCTEELKLKVFQRYVFGLHAEGYTTNIFIGVRADESENRAKMPMREWSKFYQSELYRPIKYMTAKRMFGLHKRFGIEPNPLYKLGMRRVGCKMCIMADKEETRNTAQRFPEVFTELLQMENSINSTWWRRGDIPVRYCTKVIQIKDGSYLMAPTAMDAMRWATTDTHTGKEIPPTPDTACASRYNLCE